MNGLHVTPNRVVVPALLVAVLSGTGTAADIDLADREMEQFLLGAEVIEINEIDVGTTFPKRLKLASGADVREAAFKYAQAERRDKDRPGAQGTEARYIDSYRHEVAAYKLDRALGVNMVPVAVIREIEGREGALIEWIPDALDERRQLGSVAPRDPQKLTHQQTVMNLFDALILNVNREGNQLITPDDWELHLIDHSRAFREWTELPRAFVARPASLPRSLLENLQRLDSESLEDLLGELLSSSQIEAILVRRDKILDKIAEDRKLHGDAVVFQDR